MKFNINLTLGSNIYNGNRREEMWHFTLRENYYIKWDREQPQKAPVIISFVTIKTTEVLGTVESAKIEFNMNTGFDELIQFGKTTWLRMSNKN